MITSLIKKYFPQYLLVLRELRAIWKGPGLHLVDYIHITTDSDLSRPRLNLVVPPIGGSGFTGGLLTGFGLTGHLITKDMRLRILVLGKCSSHDDLVRDIRKNSDIPAICEIEILELIGGDSILPVSRKDRFICTTWRTAYFIQKHVGGTSTSLQALHWPLIYLIQDYEPGFYPWSSEYVLARSTYDWKGNWIPVFNSESLRDFVISRHDIPANQYSFQPVYSKRLFEILQKIGSRPWQKEKIILLYGRPSTPRNGFDLLVEVLRKWSSCYEGANKWRVISVGELHKDITLGNECKIINIGMLSIEKYAEILMRSAVGLSIMISPHPSYPPLEMASCGMRVLTNSFDCKDWPIRHENIKLITNWDPESIAENLAKICRKEETEVRSARFTNTIMESPEKAYVFVDELRKDLGLS